MPRSRQRLNTAPSSGAGPAYLFVGLLLGRSGRAVQAFAPTLRGSLMAPSVPTRGRALVRPRAGDMSTLSASGGSEWAEDIDSSELYADIRRRLKELQQSRSDTGSPASEEGVSDLGLFQQHKEDGGSVFAPGGKGAGTQVKVYSAQEMKQRYYEAFWRARNLHKEAKFQESTVIQDDSSSSSSSDAIPPVVPPPEAQAAPRTTMLSPMAMAMFLSRGADPADTPVVCSSSDVQGLTQVYYLEEEEDVHTSLPAVSGRAEAAGVGCLNRRAALALEKQELLSTGAGVEGVTASCTTAADPLTDIAGVGGGARRTSHATSDVDDAVALSPEPQGLTQVFFLDPRGEADATAALPVVPGRSFLRERLGVPGEVVQNLRQVELDHARLAMLAVLLSGAVGAGAGAGAGMFLNTHDGLSTLADVARTPWLDPYVAGGILAAKALSEGDWRIGKGALAGWADQALSTVSNAGAKVLRLGSGNELRRLAVEMEVKHGRMALGAVVCAMAQQGIFTVAA